MKNRLLKKINEVPFSTLLLVILLSSVLFTEPAFATFETSLTNIKVKVLTIILPAVCCIGLALAALSFFTGNPNAKQHITYAIIGCIFGFGAEAIVTFISQTVR